MGVLFLTLKQKKKKKTLCFALCLQPAIKTTAANPDDLLGLVWWWKWWWGWGMSVVLVSLNWNPLSAPYDITKGSFQNYTLKLFKL